jgi:hypothetical protein
MLTFFDLLFKIVLPIAGIFTGAAVGGSYFHSWGVIVGAVLGFFLFVFLGSIFDKVYLLLALRLMRRQFASLSIAELRSQLGTSFTPNYILVELKLRGEDVSGDLEPVLQLLENAEFNRRTRGWAALLSVFPRVADSIQGYSPARSVTECQQKIAEFRHRLELHTLHSS